MAGDARGVCVRQALGPYQGRGAVGDDRGIIKRHQPEVGKPFVGPVQTTSMRRVSVRARLAQV